MFITAQNKYEKNAQQMKKDTLTKFRKKVEQRTADFIRKADRPFIEFPPMDRIYRNIMYAKFPFTFTVFLSQNPSLTVNGSSVGIHLKHAHLNVFVHTKKYHDYASN